MMSRGRMFFSSMVSIAGPTRSHSSCFSLYAVGVEDEPGRVMPIASAAEAIVLRVVVLVSCRVSFIKEAGSSTLTWPCTCLSRRRAGRNMNQFPLLFTAPE